VSSFRLPANGNPNGVATTATRASACALPCRGAQACGLVSGAGFTPELRARARVLCKLYGIRGRPNRAMSHCVPGDALRVA